MECVLRENQYLNPHHRKARIGKKHNKILNFVAFRPLNKCHNMQQRDSVKSING